MIMLEVFKTALNFAVQDMDTHGIAVLMYLRGALDRSTFGSLKCGQLGLRSAAKPNSLADTTGLNTVLSQALPIIEG